MVPMPAGSLALIAFSADGTSATETFSFVLLDESLRGQTVYVTDNGVAAAGGFRTGEGILSFTIPIDAVIGTVFSRSQFAAAGGSLDGSGSGDSFTAFVGTGPTAPTEFLFQIDFADGNTTYASDATNTNTTAIAPSLTYGDTALAFALDNGVYTGPTTGTVDEIRANIADAANWTTNDTAIAPYEGGNFTVTDEAGPTRIAIDDVSVVEGDDGTSVLTFTVTRSDADGAFTLDYATADGSATAGSDYAAAGGSLAFTAGGALTQTISITINGDTTLEQNETFTVGLSNLQVTAGAAEITDAQGTGTIVTDDVSIVYIHDVQGAAHYSPILAGEGIFAFNQQSATQVTVRGIVTAVDTFAGSNNVAGFYITEEVGDWDANGLTSEGIFVRTTSATAGLTVGETVTVTAHVTEYQDFTNLNRTMLTGVSSIMQGNDTVALPTFVIGSDGRALPTAVTSNDNPTFFEYEAGGAFDPQQDAIDYYETIEGMRVTLPDAVVADGFVSGSDNFVYFGAYSSSLADQNLLNSRGGYTVTGDPQFYPVDTATPDDDVVTGGQVLTDGATHPDILELDFGNVGRGGTSAYDQLLTMGDRLGDVTGILDFDFNRVKLYVTDALTDEVVAGLADTPVQEVTALAEVDRQLRIATFNVENLSPVGTTFSGSQVTQEAKFDLLADQIATHLNAPDIIILEEIQDNSGTGNDGTVEANLVYEKLIAELFDRTGKTYQWVDEAPVNGAVGGAPGGNIRVGFLYDTARVQLGDLAADATIEQRRTYTDAIGDGVATAGDLIAVNDAGLGIDPADWAGTRRSIVGEFTFNGQTINVFGNHLPSKGGSEDAIQLDQDNTTGSPANGDWDTRVKLAEDIYQVQARAVEAGGRVVSGGDFNEYWFYRPLEVLTGYATEDGVAREGGVRFDNLMVEKLSAAERFSYDFDGRSQALDTMLADQAMSDVATYDVVHINTGYNDRAGAVNPASSDHDPSLALFDMRNFDEVLTTTAANDAIDGMGGTDRFVLGGDISGYVLGQSGDAITIDDVDAANGDTGTDTLFDVELLDFAGRRFLVDNIEFGTAGADELRLNRGGALAYGGDAADQIRGADGGDLIFGQGGGDTLIGAQGDDELRGGDGDDQLAGGEQNDLLIGGSGVDIVNGGNGADMLDGGIGDDRIDGGAGADVLFGGAGADRMTGGTGADRFVFTSIDDSLPTARDRVLDFNAAAGDVLDFSSIDADTAAGGDQSFTLVKGFSGTAGELVQRLNNLGDTLTIRGDVDGDGAADFSLLVGASELLPPSAFAF
jgi:predicted extracellular nuclease